MGELFTRKSLYELVWSEPLRTVCTRFGISDVALSNTCRRAMIPTPERGYWARKEAGKSTSVRQLPERAPAMDDEVQVRSKPGYISHALTEQELLGPLPNPPQFEKTLDSVRAQLIATVGKVKVPRELTYSHPAILRLLKEDEQRREKEKASGYVVSWDRPQFDGPVARRRLQILNALFVVLGRFSGKPSLERDAVKTSISFYSQHVWIKLAPSKARGGTGTNRVADDGRKLTLSILDGYSPDRATKSWSDGEGANLESQLGDIAVEIVYQAELAYRQGVEHRYEWSKGRKVELEQKFQRSKLEAEKAERSRIQRVEKERVDHLLRDAAAFEQAAVIRKYVVGVHSATVGLTDTHGEVLDAWSIWATAEADRIDPSLNGRFLHGWPEPATS